jgi:hypothetical protein
MRTFGFQNLIVYQKSFKLAIRIFEVSKSFPVVERYSLTDQVSLLPPAYFSQISPHKLDAPST